MERILQTVIPVIQNNTINPNGTRIVPPNSINRGPDYGQIHYLMMVVVWLAAGTIGLWSQLFKQYKCANYVHIISMSIVIIITWMSGLIAILPYGLNSKIGSFHTGLGIALLIALIIQAIFGLITWMYQKNSKIKPSFVYCANLLHRFFGYLIFIFVLIQLLVVLSQAKSKKAAYISVLVISLVSYIGYLIFRYCKRKMQKYNKNPKNIQNTNLLQVKSSKDLARYNNNYFIFEDKIYDINNLITHHPGGYKVIDNIRGRQVDRFLYGSQPLNSVGSTKAHSHNATSISLAGKPIGIMASNNPYPYMTQSNSAKLYKIQQSLMNKFMYIPYLVSASPLSSFLYKGYENLSQLGKYFALTINNKKTRLYSVVNFLNPLNLQLMGLITGTQTSIKLNDNIKSQRGLLPSGNYNNMQQLNLIPLLIKKYQNGSFTQQFLHKFYNKNIKISSPRGRGLNLNQIAPGNVLLLAGGTGIHPYYDLIDLLYKQYLVSKNSNFSNQILSQNPLVGQRLLSTKFRFTLFASVYDLGQIHDLILYQLDQLCRNKIMEVYLRVKQNSDVLQRNYSAIKLISEKFQNYLPGLLSNMDIISHVFICGPPDMSTRLVNNMQALNVPVNKYTVL